ncbi:MAG: TonB family protein [Alistipes sp.]|nr:TonB family protein [Alistipes sp.]
MWEFILYLGQSAACLAALYLLYKATMSYETLHRLNRVVLLGSVVLAAVLPLCHIKIEKEVEAVPQMAVVDDVAMDMVVAERGVDAVAVTQGVVVALFLLGAAVMVARLVTSQISVWRVVRSGEQRPLADDVTLTVVEKLPTPFSWFSCVVVDRDDEQSNLDLVLEHELAHIRLHHSWDVLAVDIALCVWWFNPALWLLRRELQSLHEYQADEAVLRRGIDVKTYQILLIKRAVGSRLHSVANCLNHSNLKNRITMMCKKTSSRWSAAKLLLVLPLVALSLAATATTIYVPKEQNKGNENFVETQIATADGDENPKSNNLYPMTKSELRGYLLQNLQNKQNLVGLIYTDVKVLPDGKVVVVKVAPAPGEKDGMQPLVNEVKRVLANVKITERKPAKEVAYRFEISFGHIEVNGEFVWSTVKASDEAITVLNWVEFGEVSGRVIDAKTKKPIPDVILLINGAGVGTHSDASGRYSLKKLPEGKYTFVASCVGYKSVKKDFEVSSKKSAEVNFELEEQAVAVDEIVVDKNKTVAESVPVAVKTQTTSAKPIGEEAFIKVESMPTFQGGDLNGYRNWFQSQLQYPAEAKEKGIKGRVIFSFVVEKDGSVSEFKVLNTPDKLLSAEVERVFKLTPKWEPGMQNGKAVRVKFTVPIVFML